jgi:hypothetical protein
MSRAAVERQLSDLVTELRGLREELGVAEAQFEHFAAEAEDARIRAISSSAPLDRQTYTDAQRHADAMQRHRDDLRGRIAKGEQRQDELLDRLIEERD